jgi:hypothetical protein
MQKRNWFLSKRGQLAVTIIVALVIVGVVIVLFAFPQINIFSQDVNPSSFLRNCIEPEVRDVKIVLSEQGGYSNPENYVLHQGKEVQYLCYSAENYKPCIVQQPVLVGHVEQEIENFVEPRARQCVEDLKEQYERRGFDVILEGEGNIEITVISGSIVVDFLSPMSVSNNDGRVQRFEKFGVAIDSEWYDLLSTATSIIQFESTLGDSETTLYLQYYPDLRIDKVRKDDGSTIYKLSNVVTEDEFSFATRSLVWPPGYELEQLVGD